MQHGLRVDYDYKAEFIEAVNDLIAENIADRGERIKAVDALITAYIDDIGERPDSAQLERLTDYILREELTNAHPDKITREEYPFMSGWQIALRRDREYPLKIAEEYGVDGRCYKRPTPRRRTAKESMFIDKFAKIRNKERAAQYRKDTAPGPVIPYRTTDFIECQRIRSRYCVIPEYYRS